MSDRHSKLARRAKDHGRELAQEHGPFTTPRQRRVAQRAAELLAIADMVTAQIGRDPKATVRRVTAVERAADAKLAQLGRLVGSNGSGAAPTGALQRYIAETYGPRDG